MQRKDKLFFYEYNKHNGETYKLDVLRLYKRQVKFETFPRKIELTIFHGFSSEMYDNLDLYNR